MSKDKKGYAEIEFAGDAWGDPNQLSLYAWVGQSHIDRKVATNSYSTACKIAERWFNDHGCDNFEITDKRYSK